MGSCPLLRPYEGLEVPKLYRSFIVWPTLPKPPASLVHYKYYKNAPCALTKFDRQARLVLILGGRAGPVCAPQVIAGAYLIFIISFTPTRFLDLKFTQQHTKVPLKRSNLTPDRKILHFLGELRHWRIISDKYQVWSRRRLNCELQIPPNQVSSTTLLPCPK